jgi:proteic killer suppression protein
MCRATGYTGSVIRSFRHKGLQALYEGKPSAKIQQQHLPKLVRILSALDEASGPGEMNLPGFRLHPLKGKRKGFYAVSVSGNWRVVFRFEGKHAEEVDYVDYH